MCPLLHILSFSIKETDAFVALCTPAKPGLKQGGGVLTNQAGKAVGQTRPEPRHLQTVADYEIVTAEMIMNGG